MSKNQIYTMSFANVYPLYISKAAKKGRAKSEVDEIIRYLTVTLDAATWGVELAVGGEPGRIYRVEPTGPIEIPTFIC